MSVIKLSPLDKEGVRFDRPSHEVVWQKLTNILFKDGSLVRSEERRVGKECRL